MSIKPTSTYEHLKHYLNNPPSNSNLSRLLQTAVFAKAQDILFTTYLKEEHPPVSAFTPENYRADGHSYELFKKWAEKCQEHNISSEQFKVYQTVRLAAGLGTNIMPPNSKGLAKGLVTGLRGAETIWERKLKKAKISLELQGTELVKLLEWTAADRRAILLLPEKEKIQAIEYWITKSPIFQAVQINPHLSDSLKSTYAHIFSKNMGIIEDILNSPTKKIPKMTAKELEQSIFTEGAGAINQIQQIPTEMTTKMAQLVTLMTEKQKDTQEIHQNMLMEGNSKEGLRLLRFMADTQYKHLSTTEKIAAVNQGIYPSKIGDLPTLQKLEKWEKGEEVVRQISQAFLLGAQITGALNIKIPKDFTKGIVAASSGFDILMGLGTGNPLQVLNGLQGIIGPFSHSGADINAIQHSQLVTMLEDIGLRQEQLQEMVAALQTQIELLFQLNLETAEHIDAIGRLIIENHAQVMQQLYQINFDVLTVLEMVAHLGGLADIASGENLIQTRRNEYGFRKGVFPSYSMAEAFFHDHILDFNQVINKYEAIFQENAINPLLKYKSHFQTQDVHPINAQNRSFYRVWEATRQFYQSADLTLQEKHAIFDRLFEPLTFVNDWEDVLTSPVQKGIEADSILEFCKASWVELVEPATIMRAAQVALGLHSHFTLIQNFQSGTIFSLKDLLDPNAIPTPQKLRGKNLLNKRVLPHVNLSLLQYHLISGGPFVAHLYDHVFNQMTPINETAANKIALLANNPILAKNSLLFAIRKKLHLTDPAVNKERECFRYRLAYNHSTDPSSLQQLLPGWQFSPSSNRDEGSNWSLTIPFKMDGKEEKLTIPLPHPNDLYEGKIEYPLDLYRLIECRQEVIDEIVGYTFMGSIQTDTELKKTAAQNIMFSA